MKQVKKCLTMITLLSCTLLGGCAQFQAMQAGKQACFDSDTLYTNLNSPVAQRHYQLADGTNCDALFQDQHKVFSNV